MIRRLRALGRALEFARCDPATALVRRKPRSQAMPDWVRNHRPDKPKFRGTDGTLVAFSQISSNSMWSGTIVGLLGARTTGPANGHRRHHEKGTGFGR
jgi:hypothetical protein